MILDFNGIKKILNRIPIKCSKRKLFFGKQSPVFIKQFILGTFTLLNKRIQLTDQNIYCSDQFFFRTFVDKSIQKKLHFLNV